jgi:glycine betaine catabolism A
MPTAAPIDLHTLEACLGDFPGGARTLPGPAYTSPAVFGWEMEHFFGRSWVCVGRSTLVGQPGDQAGVVAGTEGMLLIRDSAGELRAFFNTCRHRGHELIARDDSTNRNVVRCPYHRWTYGLDGTFLGGPGTASQPGFDRHDPDHSLVPVRVAEWHGWVFVDAGGDAPPIQDHAGVLEDVISDYEAERLSLALAHTYDVQANWKIIAENYHECYHCSEIHPELCRVSSPGSGYDFDPSGLVVGGTMELMDHAETMSLDGKSKGVPFRRLSGRGLRDVHYLQMWPNLLLSMHPDYVMTHTLQPLSANRTRVECAWFFPPEAVHRADFDPTYASEFWDITNREDWAACESVQRGVAGRGYRQAPFSDQERIVYQVSAMVARGYIDGGPPAPVARAGRATGTG